MSDADGGPDLLLRVRRGSGRPLAAQVEAALRDAVRDGRLAPGARLPPSRTLARDLGVSRRLVVGAFEQLASEGWLEARVGAGTFVRRTLPAGRDAPPADGAPAPPAAARPGVPDVPYDFFAGHPDLGGFPRAAWARAVRDALTTLPDAALGYGDGRGLAELRTELAAFLARSRGVVADPGRIVVCQGAVQALGLVARALGPGARIAVEDPCLPEHRRVLAAQGADVVPVPVDELGVRDQAVRRAGAAAALLTPAHQMPTGVALAAGRRAALATWAREAGTLLVDDDYDAEFRYDRSAPSALQALAPDAVAYLGSASKVLAPALRLAWLVVPAGRLDAVVAAKRFADGGSPVLEQAALARLLASGALERHLRGARRRHGARRAALVRAVAQHLPEAEVTGIAAGLHAVVRLPRAVPARPVALAARAAGVGVYPLSFSYADPPPETSALVLGYGALSPAAIHEGIRRLATVLPSL
ncbi:MAG TPA: PLP-dependent aminotransferase family protein [Baekduia sp.]|nr:PLP-dependent aminotransferase family protein [Baekduia sp.]